MLERVACVVLVLAASATVVQAKEPWVDGGRLSFDLHGANGEPIASSDARFAGKVLLVDLWGTWCPPCITEIPTLIDLQQRYGEQGLVIVAIAFEDQDDAEARRAYLERFAADEQINYLILDGGSPDDFESALPDVRGIRGFPVEILIDRNGHVRDTRNGYGYKKKWVKKLTGDLEALLAEPAP